MKINKMLCDHCKKEFNEHLDGYLHVKGFLPRAHTFGYPMPSSLNYNEEEQKKAIEFNEYYLGRDFCNTKCLMIFLKEQNNAK